jgi:MFS family permease
MYAIGSFLSPYLQRFHGQQIEEAGRISGVNYCFGGLGILLGGWACDWWGRRRMSGRLEICTLAFVVAAPCVYMAIRQPPGHPWAFAAWLLPASFMFYVYYAGVYATIQDVVEPARRGTAMGIYFLAMYFLGAAAGPVLLGALSDHFAARAAAERGALKAEPWDKAIGLHDAFFIVPILAGALIVVLFAGSRTAPADHRRLLRRIAPTGSTSTNEPP